MITVRIEDQVIDRYLLDLGSSANLLAYFVYKQLGLGELQPTNLIILLANKSVQVPKEIVEDVILQVNGFYSPVDLVVLDTKPVTNPSSHSPVIFGRPFFAIVDPFIRCMNEVMILSFDN